jgi:hypothetical protein
MELNVDEFMDTYVRKVFGETNMVTGWVIIAATANAAEGGDPSGFVYASSDGMPEYSKLGLVNSVSNDIQNLHLRDVLAEG